MEFVNCGLSKAEALPKYNEGEWWKTVYTGFVPLFTCTVTHTCPLSKDYVHPPADASHRGTHKTCGRNLTSIHSL